MASFILELIYNYVLNDIARETKPKPNCGHVFIGIRF